MTDDPRELRLFHAQMDAIARIRGDTQQQLLDFHIKVAQLEAENTALREIARAVADAWAGEDETLHFAITAYELMQLDVEHGDSKARRLVTKARALLAPSDGSPA